ncbi:MAG: SpoIIIAH-like family protein [Oscillospiraceae bacterium]|nr:SpoIIIAH-like family protein [Oscillospiraceae bacterium]
MIFKKRRINLIIGKKQIIIVGLTLILGVAIYINYLVGTNMTSDSPVSADKEAGSAGVYGEEQFVSDVSNDLTAENLSTDAYFAQARLDKMESRAEAIEVLQSIYAGGDSTETELAVFAQDAAALSGYIESETKIENVLKAQGFEEVLCYLSENGASIIVKTDGLTTAQAAQIKNALLSEVDIPAEKITILEIK